MNEFYSEIQSGGKHCAKRTLTVERSLECVELHSSAGHLHLTDFPGFSASLSLDAAEELAVALFTAANGDDLEPEEASLPWRVYLTDRVCGSEDALLARFRTEEQARFFVAERNGLWVSRLKYRIEGPSA